MVQEENELENDLVTIWSSIELWQSYINQRLVARQRELQQDFQEKLVRFLMEGGEKKKSEKKDFPGQQPAVSYADLPDDMKREINTLKSRIAAEVEPMILENNLAVQKLLSARSHISRLELFTRYFETERKRLEARESLKKILQD